MTSGLQAMLSEPRDIARWGEQEEDEDSYELLWLTEII